MDYHLRLAGRTGSKIEQRKIIIAIHMLRAYKWGGGFDSFLKIEETLRNERAD